MSAVVGIVAHSNEYTPESGVKLWYCAIFTLSLFSVCLIVSRVKLYLSRVVIHVPI